MKTFYSALVGLWLGTMANAETIEIMHFWVSDSESAALDVFATSYREGGGEWLEDLQPNAGALFDSAYSRIREGFPPTAMQWLVASDLGDMLDSGVIVPVEHFSSAEALAGLYPFIDAAVRFNGQIAAIPVGLHGNNWVYYNKERMDRFGFETPESWDAFFLQMDTIRAAGEPTIAIGPGIWERSLVFDALLADAGGQELLVSMRDGEIVEGQRVAVETAFANLIHYIDLARSTDVQFSSWNEASLGVAEGSATVQVMGDWAKGELVAAGFVPDEDFLCQITPGNDNQYLLTIDAFVLPYSRSEADQRAQRRFVEVVLDPENQAEFSRLKGALPVIQNVDLNLLDVCGQRGLAAIQSDDAIVMRVTRGSNPAFRRAIETVMEQIWNREIVSADDAYTHLQFLFGKAHGG